MLSLHLDEICQKENIIKHLQLQVINPVICNSVYCQSPIYTVLVYTNTSQGLCIKTQTLMIDEFKNDHREAQIPMNNRHKWLHEKIHWKES
jgi:hypothetical protein